MPLVNLRAASAVDDGGLALSTFEALEGSLGRRRAKRMCANKCAVSAALSRGGWKTPDVGNVSDLQEDHRLAQEVPRDIVTCLAHYRHPQVFFLLITNAECPR